MAFFVITTMAISAVVLYIAKVTIAKVRPITSERYPHIKDSLPSGHTMMVTVIFVSLAILGFKNNFYLLGVLAFVPPIVMACSRVVAGEHFVDDIIAGWLFGITCVVGVHLLYFYYVPYL
jgi:membrane-associated phospholipid phosphatase